MYVCMYVCMYACLYVRMLTEVNKKSKRMQPKVGENLGRFTHFTPAFFSPPCESHPPPPPLNCTPGVYLFAIQKSCFQWHSLSHMPVVETVEGHTGTVNQYTQANW